MFDREKAKSWRVNIRCVQHAGDNAGKQLRQDFNITAEFQGFIAG